MTVVVVALTTAFLIGTAVLLLTAASFTATFAEPLSGSATATYYENPATAEREASDNAIVVPLAKATRNGETVRVIGIPRGAPSEIRAASTNWQAATLPQIPLHADARGPVASNTTVTLVGLRATETLTVVPHEQQGSIFADQWYATNASTAINLGPSAAFVIDPNGTARSGLGGVPQTGVPLVSALFYVLSGLQQILLTLAFGVGAGGLLVLIVVYSVTRMTIRDRTNAIRVIRSTGGTTGRILWLFTLRAGLVVTIGVVAGYSVGLVTTKAIVNAAIYVGLPIALDVAISGRHASLVLVIAGILVVMGLLAGLLAAYPAATRPPAQLDRNRRRPTAQRTNSASVIACIHRISSPILLSWRSLVPTAATLAVFALTVLLVASVAGLASPLGGASDTTGTITEQDAPHPLNSRLDLKSARILRANGVPASPEVIYAQVHDGEPYMVHGANFTAFANVTGATLVAGHKPRAYDEAVIGSDLARTMDFHVGETITLGGSVSPGIRRITVVGRYEASGTLDDLLLIPIETTWNLAISPNTVHIIRVSGPLPDGATEDRVARLAPNATPEDNIPESPSVTPTDKGAKEINQTGVVVTSLSGPPTAVRGDRFNLTVGVRNFNTEKRTYEVTVVFGNETKRRTVTVPPKSEKELTIPVRARTVGSVTARSGSYSHTVTVVAPNEIRIPSELPTRTPPGATLYVPVVSKTDDPVSGVTVTLNGLSIPTNKQGVAVLPVPESEGNYTITARKGNQTARHEIRVVAGTTPRLAGRLIVSPQSGNVLTRPTITVLLGNPWGQPLTSNISVVGPGRTRTNRVTIGPGNATRTKVTLGDGSGVQFHPGSYTIKLSADGTTLATANYTVTGDERLTSAIASSGQFETGTTLERSIEGVFGNVQLILIALIVLAALSTIGGTTATFAQAVHARRQAIGIHRSTGAPPERILRLILGDVIRIAVPATLLAVGLSIAGMQMFQWFGLLVFFGFQLPTTASPLFVVGIAAGGVIIAITGAIVALIPYLRAPPVSLLPAGDRVQHPDAEQRPTEGSDHL